MSNKYKVMVVGVGKRGMHHATAFNANPKFEVVGLCDIDQARLDAAAAKLGNSPKTGTNAGELAKALKPDVFCFCTMPHIRLPMIQAGLDCGAKMIAFEKPLAPSSADALTMREMLKDKPVKVVVSHQHRYGAHYRKVKEIIASGAIGQVHTVYGTSTGWMLHMITHLIDYMRWYNGEADAQWVMGQAAGRGKLTDNHPSPDYIAGVIQFANGVRGYIESGAGAPDIPEVAKWWGKCRIGAQGTEGFAEVLTNGGWRAVTKDGVQKGEGAMNYDVDMPPYIQDMADWLDNDAKVHPCNFASAYKGFEIMAGLCRSAARGGQVALPLTDGANEIAELTAKLGAAKVLVSCPGNAKEFGL